MESTKIPFDIRTAVEVYSGIKKGLFINRDGKYVNIKTITSDWFIVYELGDETFVTDTDGKLMTMMGELDITDIEIFA